MHAEPHKPEPLTGGPLLAAISTSIVTILRDRYGRGPMQAKTYTRDDMIVVVLRGSGFTALEQTMIDSGEPALVGGMRQDFQRLMAGSYSETIERLTGRRVLAALSQAHVDPDITMEVFFIDAPLAEDLEAPAASGVADARPPRARERSKTLASRRADHPASGNPVPSTRSG